MPWAFFREGLAFVRTTPWLLVNLLCGLVLTFAISGSLTLLPFLVTDGYGEPASRFGYLLAIGGASATLTAVVTGTLAAVRRPLASSYVCYAAGLVAIAGLGGAPDLALAAACVAAMFAGMTAGNVLQDSVIGTCVPRHMRGRVGSLDWVAATAAAPLSVTLSASVAGAVGIRATYVGAGLVAAAAALVGLGLLWRSGEPERSEQPGRDVVETAQRLVVEGDAVDAAVAR